MKKQIVSSRIKNNSTALVNVNYDKESVLVHIRSREWKHWLNRPSSPFWATFVWKGIDEKYFEKAGFDFFAEETHLYQYPDMFYSTKLEDKSSRWAKKFFARNRVERLTKMLEKTHRENMRRLDDLLQSQEDIEKRAYKFFEDSCLYIPYLWLVLPIENYFNRQIEKEFKKYYPNNYQKIAADWSVPTKKTAYEKMLMELDAGVSVAVVQKKFAWLK